MVAGIRAGGTPVVTKPDRFARPSPMFENIIEDMTRLSQEFRLLTGMIMWIGSHDRSDLARGCALSLSSVQAPGRPDSPGPHPARCCTRE